jgi:sulfotransferase
MTKRGQEIIFLSGLPRTGSTLLTAILSQNPDVHTQGNSALCQIMWDAQVSCWQTEQMKNSPDFTEVYLKAIPKLFYKSVNNKVVIDKCRSWTLPANLELIEKYITKKPKIVVMHRPISEIVKSLVFIRKMNNWQNPESGLLDDNSEPIIRSFNGLKNAKLNDDGQFHFISYDDLITEPFEVFTKLYEFCEIDNFEHNFLEIDNPNYDSDLSLVGLHEIRSEIGRRIINVELSDELQTKVELLDLELKALLA